MKLAREKKILEKVYSIMGESRRQIRKKQVTLLELRDNWKSNKSQFRNKSRTQVITIIVNKMLINSIKLIYLLYSIICKS